MLYGFILVCLTTALRRTWNYLKHSCCSDLWHRHSNEAILEARRISPDGICHQVLPFSLNVFVDFSLH